MIRYFLFFAAALLATAVAPTAWADQFTFNVDFCSNPCLGGVPASNNGGTVTLTQDGTNIVDVKVSLSSSLLFHDQGLESFAFDILLDGSSTNALTLQSGTSVTGSGQIALVNGGGGSWTFEQPPSHSTDGAGQYFEYGWDCSGGAGACSPATSSLEFKVDLTGLTPANFETLAGWDSKHDETKNNNVDFAANVANGSCTGMIGAGNGTAQSTAATVNSGGTACTGSSTVPEPTAILLLGTALACAGKVLKGYLAA